MEAGSQTYTHSIKVDQAGVLKLMQGLNPHKAEGPDHIPTRFLKEFAAELSPPMTLIFQASLQQGEVPDDWKQANVASTSTSMIYAPSVTLDCYSAGVAT